VRRFSFIDINLVYICFGYVFMFYAMVYFFTMETIFVITELYGICLVLCKKGLHQTYF
jgi:hypothetical protein